MQAASIPSVLMEREASERKRGRPAVAHDILQVRELSLIELIQQRAVPTYISLGLSIFGFSAPRVGNMYMYKLVY